MTSALARSVTRALLGSAAALAMAGPLAAQADSMPHVITDYYTPHCNRTNVHNDTLPFCRTIRPLIVIDGEPIADEDSGRAADLDPDEIISVENLGEKDAVAIYGPTALGGLLLVTTKHSASHGCRPKPDSSATARPPEFIQIDGPAICGAYANYVLVVNGAVQDPARSAGCSRALDPTTIESIILRKPAAAASEFGAKASTGAIVITLKDGIKPPCDP